MNNAIIMQSEKKQETMLWLEEQELYEEKYRMEYLWKCILLRMSMVDYHISSETGQL